MIKNHPIEPEEVMAYLDGELSPERAVAAGTHLEHCGECQGLAAELRGVSQSLKKWNFAPPNGRIADQLTAALDTHWDEGQATTTAKFNWLNPLRLRFPSLAWIGVAATILTIIVIGSTPNRMVFQQAAAPRADLRVAPGDITASGQGNGRAPAESASPNAKDLDRLERSIQLSQPPAVNFEPQNAGPAAVPFPTGPMIIRTAGVTIITKDFDPARARVEEIVRQHHGYVGQLNVTGATGSGRTLQATLRIPANELDAALNEMKKLGRVEGESQNGQDVTSQYVDLQARLTNARNTEQRLTDLLRERTGKLSDVLAVETELSRVRGEIEQMEAERKSMLNQVTFATLSATVTEDYQAQLQVVPPSTSTRLVNAAIDGYRSMVDGLLSVTLFLLSAVPSLLLWGAILFFPARFAWKKLRRSITA